MLIGKQKKWWKSGGHDTNLTQLLNHRHLQQTVQERRLSADTKCLFALLVFHNTSGFKSVTGLLPELCTLVFSTENVKSCAPHTSNFLTLNFIIIANYGLQLNSPEKSSWSWCKKWTMSKAWVWEHIRQYYFSSEQKEEIGEIWVITNS